MKIIIAPDSYKESLSAKDVADNIELGFKDVFPYAKYYKLPMADGGEGTVEAMIAATRGKKITLTVTDPLGNPVTAFYGISGDGSHAFIEMAAASGLSLIPLAQRSPCFTTSYGTGELIRHALDQGVSQITIGIGGSATNDGGAGMAQALGVRFLDSGGKSLDQGGAALAYLRHIDISSLDSRLATTCIDVACDVTNPLLGERGTSIIFGPQKGATTEMIQQLDDALQNYASVLLRDTGKDVAQLPGVGAGGGIGAALAVFCAANLRSGIDIVIDLLGLEALVKDADLVITGEGRLDSQSIYGKVPFGVSRIAARYQKPVIVVAGSLSQDVGIVYQCGIHAAFSVLHQVCTLEEALRAAPQNIRLAARNIAAVLKLGAGSSGCFK